MSAPAHPLLAALSASPGPHPPLAELRAYAAGTLSGPAAHGIEAHALACARCADLLEGLEITDAATTDRAVADLQLRLRQRVGELSERPNPSALVRFRPRPWPRLATAAALVAGLGAGLWGWQHRPAAEPKSAEVAMQPTPAPTPPVAPEAPAPGAAEVSAPPAQGALPPVGAAAPGAAPRRPQLARSRGATGRPAVRAASDSKAAASEQVMAAREVEADYEAGYSALAVAPAADSTARANELARRHPSRDSLSPVAAKAAATDGSLSQKTSVAKAKAAAHPSSSVLAASVAPPVAPIPGRSEAALAAVPAPAGAADAAAGAPRTRAALPPPPTLEPTPVGGYRALRTYLRKQAEAFEPEGNLGAIKGLVRVRFTVSAAGKPELDQAKLLVSLRPDYDAEVLRMLAEGPAWVPGVAAGRRAPLPVQVEVLF